MSLAELAQTLGNFDPKEDKINSGGNGLPAGEYDVVIEDASHRVFESGWDCVSFKFNVTTGDHAGANEILNLSFAETAKSGKQIPDFVLERNLKTVLTLGSLMGVKVPLETFNLPNETDIHEKLGQMLHGEIGAMAHMTITERPNKKDPANPFKEYEFAESEQTADAIEIDDDDMPF